MNRAKSSRFPFPSEPNLLSPIGPTTGWIAKLELDFWRLFVNVLSRLRESTWTAYADHSRRTAHCSIRRWLLPIATSAIALLSGIVAGLLFGPLF